MDEARAAEDVGEAEGGGGAALHQFSTIEHGWSHIMASGSIDPLKKKYIIIFNIIYHKYNFNFTKN